MSLPISRSARRRYRLDEMVGGGAEQPLVLDARTARALAHAVSRRQEGSGRQLTAGRLLALSALHALMRALVRLYERTTGVNPFRLALEELIRQRGDSWLEEVLHRFREEFGLDELDEGTASGSRPGGSGSSREWLLEELLLLSLLSRCPAARSAHELIAPRSLIDDPAYRLLLADLGDLLTRQPPSAPLEVDLFELLNGPGRRAPDSLCEQLRFAAEHWVPLLDEGGAQLDAALDLLAEEEVPRFPPGPGPVEIPSYDVETEGAARYSVDRRWMSKLVLVAKNIYVWLSQLSQEYGHPIERLDQVPDEALEELSRRGFNGLWLIGLWRRSPASRRIKRLRGNPEAEASAYSVASYRIADELGGDEALDALQERAARYGIRLAADMVPNHMAIDSEWVVDHPERFLGLDAPPFPSYRFEGPDLSPRPEVGIFLEDHYYDHSDAAVVFKRLDRKSGQVRYLYHGNDGTSIPWNDTAQLDYLNPAVREAVMETILRVARRFPLVRFDAAMTLTRRHVQRLWFPEPGQGGAIPSRAEHAMTREEFTARMPREFWREVMDRVAVECPDALLLAEAFWLMEGYFVRSLGMHRVYNSAFMNLLRDGDNAKFRRLVKETLAFDPRILKRWVNFMSNPDERTAIDQFGRGDRYFGVCVVMATLPGLPMFAHGQVEGYGERYGMEFRRAYRPEAVDTELVARHQREISPLLHRRELFAEVDHFLFYDFVDGEGRVIEDVLAFSNGRGGERVVVLYHNREGEAMGRIRESVPFAVAPNVESQGVRATRRLAETLGLAESGDRLLRFRDRVTGLEIHRSCSEIQERGLEVELGPFQYRVLCDFRVVAPDPELAVSEPAGDRGEERLPSLEMRHPAAEDERRSQAWRRLLSPDRIRRLWGDALHPEAHLSDDALLTELEAALADLIPAASDGPAADPERPGQRRAARRRLLAAITLPLVAQRLSRSRSETARRAAAELRRLTAQRPESAAGLLVWAVVGGDAASLSGRREARDLEVAVTGALLLAGCGAAEAFRFAASLVAALQLGWGRDGEAASDPASLLSDLERDPGARRLLGIDLGEEPVRMDRAAFEDLLAWRLLLGAAVSSAAEARPSRDLARQVVRWFEPIGRLKGTARRVGYQVDRLRRELSEP